MKTLICTGLLLLLRFQLAAQYNEFGASENGLIYSNTTVSQLRSIVDSLNLKFKNCGLHKVYRANAQAMGHYVELKKDNIIAARQDMDAGISYEDFLKKYPTSEKDEKLLVVRHDYKNYSGKDVTVFNSLELDSKHDYSIRFEENPDTYKRPFRGKWLYNYTEKSKYSEESIEAFYFVSEFNESPLPEIYARMVQYSECLVDTSAGIFYEKAKRTGARYSSGKPSSVSEFINYVHLATDKPEFKGKYTEEKYEKFLTRLMRWDSLRFSKTDSLYKYDHQFSALLTEALEEIKQEGGGCDELDEYVGRYRSKKEALELKRNRIVVGGCSQDNSPRIHALNIAMLSAETINWETFLRSHLDIMNDRFERVSDGSYAWAGRKTYIRELEILDINVPELLLGITLRVENPGKNHYYGSIGRLGRAIAESKDLALFSSKILEMIADNKLDDYNRVLMYYLYLNMNHYLQDEEIKKENKERLKKAISALPAYLSEKISIK
jgi:hypothetical protein